MYKCIECGKSWMESELINGKCPNCQSIDLVELEQRKVTYNQAWMDKSFNS